MVDIFDKAMKEFESFKVREPEKAERVETKPSSDIYGLGPLPGGGYGTGRVINAKFRNGKLVDIEE